MEIITENGYEKFFQKYYAIVQDLLNCGNITEGEGVIMMKTRTVTHKRSIICTK